MAPLLHRAAIKIDMIMAVESRSKESNVPSFRSLVIKKDCSQATGWGQ